MRAWAVAGVLVLSGLGFAACMYNSGNPGSGECPEPKVITAPADLEFATSCVLLVTYNGIDYSPGCAPLHPSRVGPVIDHLEGKDPRAVRSIVGVDPDHAVIFVGDGCGRGIEVAASDGLTPSEGMHLLAPAAGTGVARIKCFEDGRTGLDTPLVWGRVDGIYLEVDNRTQSPVSLTALDVDAPPGKTRLVSKVGPGTIEVSCAKGEPGERLRVKDYSGYWTSPKPLECPSGSEVVTSDEELPIDPTGELGNPRNVISEGLEGIDFPEDNPIIEGWVGDETRVVRVAHEKVPVARFMLSPTDEGGWVISRSEICSGSDIRFES